MTVRRNSFEGSTDETGLTAANSGGASGDAFDSQSIATGCTIKYDADQSAHGKFGCRFNTDGTAPNLTIAWWAASVGNLTDHYGRIYFRPSRNFAADAAFEEIVEVDSSGGVIAAQFGFDTSNFLHVRDSTGVDKLTGSVACTINGWNRLEWHVVSSTTVGQIETRMFVGSNWDGLDPDESLSSAANLNTLANAGQYYFGVLTTAVLNQVIWFDDYTTGLTGWPGPYRDPPYVPHRMPLGV